MVKIRKAKLKDLEEISKIAEEGIKFHSKYEKSLYNIDKAILFYTDWLKRSIKEDIFLIAEVEKKSAGYVYGDVKEWYPGHKVGSIIDIAVKKEYRGKGIGKKLLNSIINLLKRKGCKEIRIDVHIKNKRAFNLYKSLGFEPWKYELKKKILS